MTERESLTVLDFCVQKFQADHCYVGRAKIGAPPVKRVPLLPAKRQWAGIGISPFKPASMHDGGWIAQITGQRSDGQMFYVNVPVSYHFNADMVNASLKESYGKLEAYKDCACGIIGHERTEGKDADGNYIFRPIYSPCSIHPAVIETETLS